MMTTFLLYTAIGMFGGLVYSVSKGYGKALITSAKIKPHLRRIVFGIISDLLVGAGAGFVAGNVLGEMIVSDAVVYGLTFAAGYAGDKFLNKSIHALNDTFTKGVESIEKFTKK